jgi:hypothetical protein
MPGICWAVLDLVGSYLGTSPCASGGRSVDSMERFGAPLSARR